MNGEWPEDKSYQLMQQELDKAQEMYPTPTKFKIEMREKSKMMHNLMNLRNSSQILEREYYFDEGLGESLNDHIEGLKKKFDSITVETRRDRDNLPIVKISLAPKFKYNLDDIVNMDPATAKKIQLETEEILTSTFMPEDPKEFLKKVTQMGSNDSGLQMSQYNDIQNALHERYYGKFKDDTDGFKKEV